MGGGKKKGKGTRPGGTGETLQEKSGDAASGYPSLCLRHVRQGYGVEELSEGQRSEFLVKWAKRSRFTWAELQLHQKHGLGFEYLPAHQIKKVAPDALAQNKYMVVRHEGNLPAVGYKVGDTFYVLWIEACYGDVYNHG
ncbi:hypothetical protein [Cryptosporangium phraense]|uniref:Uncharacterized protein n=1 Tax=Cryptosporangium phraense TaxID=2593070 RepID=A0A545AQ36_9ACTN|nr:hypothetical protein [Cryptosporangium phraense]TQS42855.1 hypothetical protein FL583_22660 [Cryptosporangium phraense]